MKSEYHIIGKGDSHALAKHLAREAGLIEPMVDLIEKSRMAVDELFDYLGRMTLETVLLISASKVADEPHQGRKGAMAIETLYPNEPARNENQLVKEVAGLFNGKLI